MSLKFSRKWIIMIISIFSLALHSCKNSKKDCIKSLMDDGYTYEEAVEECGDAATDSDIRRF